MPLPLNTIQQSTIAEPQSLDEFDINLIDLRSENLWVSDSYHHGHPANKFRVNSFNDLSYLKTIIANSSNSKIIIMIPQNIDTRYHPNPSGTYSRYLELKHFILHLDEITNLLISQIGKINFSFENTKTTIDTQEYASAFFPSYMTDNCTILTTSKANKPTTIRINDRILLTTLGINLGDEACFSAFMKQCNLITSQEEYPEWLYNYAILDDSENYQIIDRSKEIITDAQNTINNAQMKLSENMNYKSILVENGELLAKQVISMLEELFNTDLSDFIDKHNEDFIVEIDDSYEFVGEIKGKTSNVTNEHLSQTELHCQKRQDEIESKNIHKTLKGLLIINHSRKKPPANRPPVDGKQVTLAEKYGLLVIETPIFLRIYEKFILGKLEAIQCINMFKEVNGLLTEDVVNNYCNRTK